MKTSTFKLVVGLGNHSLPSTRHSIGMSALNHLAECLGIGWTYDKKCSGFIAQYMTETGKILLLRPKLAMNINGKSILRTVNQYQIPTENILLVQDDLDKPLGKIRMRLEGTASGHNGVKSAFAALKTDKLKRFKIGIGRPIDKSQVVDYVLHNFNQTELPLVDETLTNCVSLLLDELGINSSSKVDSWNEDDRGSVLIQCEPERLKKQSKDILVPNVSEPYR